MRFVAAALLTALGGKEVNKANLKNILDSVGIDADAEKMKIVLEQLKGKNLEELMTEGLEKLATMPSGGGAATAAAPAAGGAAPAAAKAEAKEEEKEESDDDMGFGLFD
jgi:large subunit ribosomal protein LP2